MTNQIRSGTIHGLKAELVSVETDISEGMPVFEMVGSLSHEVREGRERVRTVLKTAGFPLPARRIIVNLSPADLKKSGSGFDLAVACSVLAALGGLDTGRLTGCFICGELRLSGEVLPVRGILPMLLEACEQGITRCIIPKRNLNEAAMVPGIAAVGVSSFQEVISFIRTGEIPDQDIEITDDEYTVEYTDFAQLHGQKIPRRACEIAAAGMHNLLMYGPPGAGKSMIASCLPSIMPPITDKEKLELMKIYSVCGRNPVSMDNIRRPFRSPHHTLTAVAMAGGGSSVMPGEVTMAHNGVLFLDELPEFRRDVLEVLRQPLEEGSINIVRNRRSEEFPADFLLVAAMNPCKCGYYPTQRCTCSINSIHSYLSRLSQPLLDRFDLCVETKKVGITELMEHEDDESSDVIRERVVAALEVQKDRYKNENYTFNSQASSQAIEEYCRMSQDTREYMGKMAENDELTARGYYRIMKVARTIADLDNKKDVECSHIAEAFYFRSPDRRFWEVRV